MVLRFISKRNHHWNGQGLHVVTATEKILTFLRLIKHYMRSPTREDVVEEIRRLGNTGRVPATQPQSTPRPVCHSPNFGTNSVRTGLKHHESARRNLGLPVRRYVDGIISHEAQDRPVQSEIRASHGRRGDESWEEEDCSIDIDETPEHLMGPGWVVRLCSSSSICHVQ